VGAHHIGKTGKITQRIHGAIGPLRLRLDGHEVAGFGVLVPGGFIAIAAAIFLGSKKEFRYQHRLLAQPAQAFEIVGRHPAIGNIHIVIGGNDIHPILHGQHRILMIVER